ncbi:hypothetical protein [Anaerosinus massiliensis]|uniref:hypothetical protein n=1 Tax=Massilibacillus massiliensis TaxID=1806837 RepID=UPI000AFA5F1C|nr:hypothetical protein [Massilibacillus massiliensis]
MNDPIVLSPAFSRRNFLQASAGTLASLALLSIPKLSFANSTKISPTTLANCPTNPRITAQRSEMIQNSYQKMIALIKSITQSKLRNTVLQIIENPAPTLMQQYTANHQIETIYHKLLSEKLVDPAVVNWDTLFPKYNSVHTSPQPFISAPGSGYHSHHSYPGGLTTHTTANLSIADAVCSIYQEVYGYQVDRDIVIAAEALHDLHKPWVFQWNEDGTCLPELPIAGTGSHHVLSIAESIYRSLPADVIVAQACAHNHPGSAKDEADVVGWIKAAAIIAGKDPIALGLLSTDGKTLPVPHKQEGYIVHLADHDWVLSVPAAQASIQALQEVAKNDYNMTIADLKSSKFNHFRNYIASQVSMMQIHYTLSDGGGTASVKSLVNRIIKK